jgi:hypothetical protein
MSNLAKLLLCGHDYGSPSTTGTNIRVLAVFHFPVRYDDDDIDKC